MTHDKLAWLIAVGFTCISVMGCNPVKQPRGKRLLDQMVATMEQSVEVLSSIKDEKSARAAKPKLEKLMQEYRRMSEEFQSTPPPPKEEYDRGTKRLRELDKQIWEAKDQYRRLAQRNPEVKAILDPILGNP
ncbi:MAG TPA: hypothetical protein PKA83_20065 [Pirellulaceae bacterium]|nr:hypothetical protein [Pirellulaceae bacterium]